MACGQEDNNEGGVLVSPALVPDEVVPSRGQEKKNYSDVSKVFIVDARRQ